MSGTRLFFAVLLAGTFGLSACAPAKLDTVNRGPALPGNIDVHEDDVDGLIIGHRLMAAGQYELALKAYLQAAGQLGLTPDVLSALGSANLKLNRLGQAEDLLRQAVKKDQTFVPAWNNLGVVLIETDRPGEARRVFQTAFALDSGESAQIRENLRLAIARTQPIGYGSGNDYKFDLVRRGSSEYRLLSTP